MRFRLSPTRLATALAKGAKRMFAVLISEHPDSLKPISLDKQLLMLEKSKDQTTYAPIQGKRKRPENQEEMDCEDLTLDIPAAKRVKTGIVDEADDVKFSDMPILGSMQFTAADSNMDEFRKALNLALKGEQRPLHEILWELSNCMTENPTGYADLLRLLAKDAQAESVREVNTQDESVREQSAPEATAPEKNDSSKATNASKEPKTPAKQDDDADSLLDYEYYFPSEGEQRGESGAGINTSNKTQTPTKRDDASDSLLDYEYYFPSEGEQKRLYGGGIDSPKEPQTASQQDDCSSGLPDRDSDDLVMNAAFVANDEKRGIVRRPITHDDVVMGRVERFKRLLEIHRGTTPQRSPPPFTETSGSRADGSRQWTSVGSTLDNSPDNVKSSEERVEVPRFFHDSHLDHVQEWVENAEADSEADPTALSFKLTEEEYYEQEYLGRLVGVREEEGNPKNEWENSEEERQQQCPREGRPYEYAAFHGQNYSRDSQNGDQPEIIHETVDHGIGVLTSEFIPPKRPSTSEPRSTFTTEDDAERRARTRVLESGNGTVDEPDVVEEHTNGLRHALTHYQYRRKGADIIVEARLNRAPQEAQQAIGNLTSNLLQQYGGHSHHELGRPTTMGPAQSGPGASRTLPTSQIAADGEPAPISRKRKSRADEEPPNTSVPELIAQTTPSRLRHTREAKRARTQRQQERQNFPIHQEEAILAARLQRRSSPRYSSLNYGHIKENITPGQTERSIRRWFDTTEARRNPMLTLATGGLEDEEEVGGRDGGRTPEVEEPRRGREVGGMHDFMPR